MEIVLNEVLTVSSLQRYTYISMNISMMKKKITVSVQCLQQCINESYRAIKSSPYNTGLNSPQSANDTRRLRIFSILLSFNLCLNNNAVHFVIYRVYLLSVCERKRLKDAYGPHPGLFVEQADSKSTPGLGRGVTERPPNSLCCNETNMFKGRSTQGALP